MNKTSYTFHIFNMKNTFTLPRFKSPGTLSKGDHHACTFLSNILFGTV